jgi:hypothetical protein
MNTEDQKRLEFIYEQQIAEDFSTLLDEEIKLAELVSEKAILDLIRAVDERINNNGKIDFEYLNDFLTPNFDEALNVFGSDKKIVEEMYRVFLVRDVYESLVYVKIKGNTSYIFFKSAEWIINPYNEEKQSIPIKDKKTIKEALQKLIENVFLIRYKSMSMPRGVMSYLKKIPEWVNWRKDKLKFQELRRKLPELEGVF